MSTEIIDRIATEMEEYSKLNFGLMFGRDFPEIARVLIESDRFTSKAFLATALVSMTSGRLLEKLTVAGEALKNTAVLRDVMRGAPIEKLFLEMFYWGYQFGKQAAEVEALHKIGQAGAEK